MPYALALAIYSTMLLFQTLYCPSLLISTDKHLKRWLCITASGSDRTICSVLMVVTGSHGMCPRQSEFSHVPLTSGLGSSTFARPRVSAVSVMSHTVNSMRNQPQEMHHHHLRRCPAPWPHSAIAQLRLQSHCSPTWRNNPQPAGLVGQSPYNRRLGLCACSL